MKVQGSKSYYSPVRVDFTRIVISYNPQEVSETDYTWNELVYYQKQGIPSFEQIKEDIIADANNEVKNTIISGFTWLHMPVWLSTENQANYKNALDIALQTDGSNLPITFKFGTDESPVYYTFDTVDSLKDFWVACSKHITDAISEGWRVKDNINWDDYKFLEM